MRQHLSTAKTTSSSTEQRVMSHLQTIHATAGSEYYMLKKQLANISAQPNSLKNEIQNQSRQQKTNCLI